MTTLAVGYVPAPIMVTSSPSVHNASAQEIANDVLSRALSCLDATLSDAQILTTAELS